MMYMVRKRSKKPQKCINGVETLVDYLKSMCLQVSPSVSLSSQINVFIPYVSKIEIGDT